MRFTNLALGFGLSLLTAVGCISYEKLVKAHGYAVILFLNIAYLSAFFVVMMVCGSPMNELQKMYNDGSSWKHATVYMLTGSTSIIWFFLTKRTNVASGSVFEIAYVPFLILIYWLFSITQLSAAFIAGTLLVLTGVLLITWSQGNIAAMTTLPAIRQEQKPFKPYGAALQLFYCRDKMLSIEGPTRTGKTRGMIEKDLYCAMRWPLVRVLWLRKTRASMTESILQTFEDHVLPVGSPIKSGAKREQRSGYDLPNGSKIVIGGLDNVDRIMSSEYDIISVFEATETRQDEVENLLTRLSNTAMPFRQIKLDENPGAPSHWINQTSSPVVNVDRSNYASVQTFNSLPAAEGKMRRLLSRLEDNPVMYDQAEKAWTVMGLEYLETLSRLGGVRKKRKVEGIWAAAEGLVYANFENCIVRATDAAGRPCDLPPLSLPSPALRVCAGLDWGWTDPLAVKVVAECHDGKIRVVEEFVETKVPPDVMAVRLKALMAKWGIETFFCDPSRPELIALMRRYDIPCVAHKVHLIETGIALVETRIDAGFLEVYSCCVNLIREAGEYEYAKTTDGRAKTTPVPGSDHSVDALRYAICGMDFGHTLMFSPQAKAADGEIVPAEPTPETLARLGIDPAKKEAEEKAEQEAAYAAHQRELLEGDAGWTG